MMKKLKSWFDSPGEKIKSFAFAMFIVDSICGILGGFIAFIVGTFWLTDDSETGIWLLVGGVATMVLALPAAWVSNILLYAFGELVENSGKQTPSPMNNIKNQPLTPNAVPDSPSVSNRSVTPQNSHTEKPQSAPSAPRPNAATKQPLEENDTLQASLQWACRFSTNDGLIRYLTLKKNYPAIAEILKLPAEEIRPAIVTLLEQLQAEKKDTQQD
jgi:hypothetical protein